MMTKRLFLVAISAFLALALNAQVRYVDATSFPMIGKATTATSSPYDRLPDSLEHRVRPALWKLGLNSAGMAVRFRSNTTQVKLKWENLNGFHMNHMTDTGIRGFDLYILLDNGVWRFAGSARPGKDKANEVTIVRDMARKEREFMLYLPLYDGVVKAEIGVDSASVISSPEVSDPVTKHPVVFYGTSILQGGCASRPGMAFTNIVERQLHRECINLGFSGNGQLDLDIARVMAPLDASVFVLDFVPNCTVEQMQDSMMTFYGIIRKQHPKTPILFVEQPVYTHALFNQTVSGQIKRKNEVTDSIFAEISKADKYVRLLKSTDMIGHDGEATVDGTHFTDLGMMRYANILIPLLREMIKP